MSTKFVIHSKVVDNQTVIRKLRKLNRDVCNICGYSVCDVGNLPPYETLGEDKQEEIKNVLRAHKDYAHPTLGKTVIREEDLPKSFLRGQTDDGNTHRVGWQSEPRRMSLGDN